MKATKKKQGLAKERGLVLGQRLKRLDGITEVNDTEDEAKQ